MNPLSRGGPYDIGVLELIEDESITVVALVGNTSKRRHRSGMAASLSPKLERILSLVVLAVGATAMVATSQGVPSIDFGQDGPEIVLEPGQAAASGSVVFAYEQDDAETIERLAADMTVFAEVADGYEGMPDFVLTLKPTTENIEAPFVEDGKTRLAAEDTAFLPANGETRIATAGWIQECPPVPCTATFQYLMRPTATLTDAVTINTRIDVHVSFPERHGGDDPPPGARTAAEIKEPGFADQPELSSSPIEQLAMSLDRSMIARHASVSAPAGSAVSLYRWGAPDEEAEADGLRVFIFDPVSGEQFHNREVSDDPTRLAFPKEGRCGADGMCQRSFVIVFKLGQSALEETDHAPVFRWWLEVIPSETAAPPVIEVDEPPSATLSGDDDLGPSMPSVTQETTATLMPADGSRENVGLMVTWMTVAPKETGHLTYLGGSVDVKKRNEASRLVDGFEFQAFECGQVKSSCALDIDFTVNNNVRPHHVRWSLHVIGFSESGALVDDVSLRYRGDE